MPILSKIRRLLVESFIEVRAGHIAMIVLAYFISCWLLLRLCGETALTAWPDFIYYILVTASTVGYGDLSPSTPAGRWVVGLYVIPFGLGLFALAVGRAAAAISDQWRKEVRGLKTLDCHDHFLVFGWNGQRTLLLLDLLLRENEQAGRQTPVVLFVTDDMDNPLPDKIGFVHAPEYSDDAALARAGLERARSIIVDIDDDHTTLTTALYCSARNAGAHLIAYFHDESLATLLKSHCPHAECTPSVAVEMIAKAAFDPGSSTLTHKLLSVEHGQTQYSTVYPDERPPAKLETLFTQLKKHHEATLIGVRQPGDDEVRLNPPLDADIAPGSVIFYIAATRIHQIDWNLADAG